MTVHHPIDPDVEPEPGRLAAIRSSFPDPMYVFLLGFLSIPGYLFERFASLQLFALFFLAGLWPLVVGLATTLFGMVTGNGTDETDTPEPTDWIDMGDRATNARALASMLLLQFQPILLLTGILQMVGHIPILARHRGRLPSPATYESDVDYRLPLEGSWTVVNGSPDREYSHSWGILTQRYAYDFVITDDDGRTHEGERSLPEDYYCFGEPILAPADGVVVSVRNDHRDYHRTDGRMDPFQRSILGNNVILRHADDEYSVLAHLERGSVAVDPGDRVERGQRIARCGNSGNTTEPHLHFHVQDHPNFFLGAGLPIRFADVGTDHPRTETESHDAAYVHAGQRVRPVNGTVAE
ncbi:peptidoglycan DD-metalloendopeptidase family protein [Natronorubrum sp. JWXQ-INN-674]|uniref:Peptidoglycan DD-metalloendopeptidase family protein n=1 Tax=Natronorubrum halalkaliphilum TaxID=2691917 RepID=A0A6B0VNP7_9EURY|nr:M23 family metallopeptidase [Natronorubrum halalkaliphilum]MXV63260.1 peptidoglycan DD-metalloendopeptidase family protein [Natronorubrum halalkaliphilum]